MDANIGSFRRTRWTGTGIRILALGLVLAGVGSLAGDAPALGRDRPLRVPVLMYHRITAAPRGAGLPQLWVSPRLFRAQLRLLSRHGWQTITAEELARAALAGRTIGPRRFVITLDDGARDGFRNAAPILERLGMRATYCVVPGRTGRDWQLTASQMRRLHARGHEIANHSFTHASLPSLGAHALRRQIAWAADRIRRYVGDRPVTLCYPFGHHDRRVERVVARTGHLSAYTTVAGAAGARRERFRWPRVRVSASTSPRQLLARLEPFAHGGGREPHRPVIAASSGILLSTTLPMPVSAPEVQPTQTALVAAARSRLPNIVVLMLDDVGAQDGRLFRRLPAIRHRFLERGIAFTDFHGETPTCCPGRVGFLTGLHTHAHGVTYNDGRLFKPRMSLATQLQRRGYFTVLAGKYVNLYQDVWPKVPPGWSQFHGMEVGFHDYTMWSNGRSRWHGRRASDYSTDVVTRKLLDSLDRAPRRRPVFLWATPYAAHSPTIPARRHRDDPRCEGIPRWSPPGYMERDVRDKPAYVRRPRLTALRGMSFGRICRTLLAVDDLLRRVTAKLEAQGRLANTIFILTSDNGMSYGMQRRFGKRSPYATQLPFYVSWPARIGRDRGPVSDRLQNIDLAPTLCELVGCRMGPYPTGQRRPDGRSFLRLLLGTGPAPRRPAVLESFRTAGIEVPRWYGVTTTRHSRLAGRGCELAGDRGCRWQYVRYETGEEELYDVSNGPCWEWQAGDAGDPCRLNNLARRSPFRDIKRELRADLAALRRE